MSFLDYTLVEKNMKFGYLAASVEKACDSRSWGCKLEPHIGYRDYLEVKSLKKYEVHFR